MSDIDHLRDLHSDDPRVRFRALVQLKHNYDHKVGNEIVQLCIRETAPTVWSFAARCALPIWLPLLDNTLVELEEWPFSGAQTLRIIELAKPNPFNSTKRFIDAWSNSEQWEFRFAAFRSMMIIATMTETCRLANELHSEINSFQVNEDSIEYGFWMTDFSNVQSRREELLSFLADCCDEQCIEKHSD